MRHNKIAYVFTRDNESKTLSSECASSFLASAGNIWKSVNTRVLSAQHWSVDKFLYVQSLFSFPVWEKD